MNLLKYNKKTRKAIRHIYGITNTELDILLFCFDEDRFPQSALFNNYIGNRESIIDALQNLVRKEYLYIYSEYKPRKNQPRYYRISAMGKIIVNRVYSMLKGEEHIPTTNGKPITK